MGITDRVEQLNRVLEAMNSWHAANGRAVHDGEPGSPVGAAPLPPAYGTRREPARAPDQPGLETPEPRPLERLVDDLLPVPRGDAAALEVAASTAEALGLGYHLGSAVERIASASGRGSAGVTSLREAVWLIERYTELLERRPVGADLHASSARLARTGDAIAGLQALSMALEAESARGAGGSAVVPDAPVAMVEPTVTEPVAEHPSSLGHDIAFMAARWAIMAVAVIVVVLAVTLIGQWL